VQSRTYEITFAGQAGTTLRAEFDDCDVSVGAGTTTLRAGLLDQGALQGLMQRIASLGLELLEVRVVASPPAELPAATSSHTRARVRSTGSAPADGTATSGVCMRTRQGARPCARADRRSRGLRMCTGEPSRPWQDSELRRQPVRIVDGRMEGGYAHMFELICPSCSDHPHLDYSEVWRGYSGSAGLARWRPALLRMRSTWGCLRGRKRPEPLSSGADRTRISTAQAQLAGTAGGYRHKALL